MFRQSYSRTLVLHRQLIAHLAHDITTGSKLSKHSQKWMDLSKEVLSVGDNTICDFAPQALSGQEERILKLFANAKNSGQVAKELGNYSAQL